MIDENTIGLGFAYLKYILQSNLNEALQWMYPNRFVSSEVTILCSTNESVDRWNAIVAQKINNTSEEHKLMSKVNFEEVDDPYGHIQKMLTKLVLNSFQKNGFPNHKLILKTGDLCLVTRAINGPIGLANNSQVKDICVHRHSVEVCKIGDHEESTIKIPHITFKFRLPYGKSYQLTRKQFPLQLAHAMTYNKSQSQTLSKVLLDITSPPFGHDQLYLALSRVQDYNSIALYGNDEQLINSDELLMGCMPTVNNTVYQDVLAQWCQQSYSRKFHSH
jgi:ATP-dependent exoDNAse (exonuclease V) alpha subunit